MTPSSPARKVRKALKNVPKRSLTPAETMELQEMQRLVNSRKFEAVLIKGNTALVQNGQQIAEQYAAIAALLDNTKNQWVSQKLSECGYSPNDKCNINLTTGEVLPETV